MESMLPKHFAAIPVELEEHFKAEPENFKMFAYTGKLLDKFPLFLRESFKIPRFPDEPEEQSCSKLTREVLCELRECMSPAEATTAARELLNLTINQIEKLRLDEVAAHERARSSSEAPLTYARNEPNALGRYFAPLANIWFTTSVKVRKVWVLCYVIHYLEGPPTPYVAHLTKRIDELAKENSETKVHLYDLMDLVQEMRGAPGPEILTDCNSGEDHVEQIPVTNIGPRAGNVITEGISTRGMPISLGNVNRRAPAPTFSGEKYGTDVITWLGQFGAYAQILNLHPSELVAHASLCLSGRAAKEWALMKQSLTTLGQDVEDFEVFKREMASQFADAGVETTVRTRLAQLKQTGSVAQYHASFRAIMVEAVTAPVTGPEACSYFREGLKPRIHDRINLDTAVRHEVFNLDVIVRAAKEAEAYLGVAVGPADDKGKGKRPADNAEGFPPKKGKPLRPQGGARPPFPGPRGGPFVPAPNRPGKKGSLYVQRLKNGLCFKCGSPDHLGNACRSGRAGPSNA